MMNFGVPHEKDEARRSGLQQEFVMSQGLTECRFMADLHDIGITILEIYHNGGWFVPAENSVN